MRETIVAEPKLTKNSSGEPMHHSVGAIIRVDGKYLLIDRDIEPFGFAAIAGHIGVRETAETALFRKVYEESGLKVKKHALLFEEEIKWNLCRVGVSSHYWHAYVCSVEGKLRQNTEAAKSIGWYAPEEMKKLKMEPVWEYWFKKLGVL